MGIGLTVKGHKGSYGDDENVLKLIYGNGYTTWANLLDITKLHRVKYASMKLLKQKKSWKKISLKTMHYSMLI